MTTTLSNLRYNVERVVQDALDNQWVIDRCNDAQADFGLDLNIASTTTISLTTTDLEYTLPADLKVIARLWLQSDYDNGIDKPFTWPYRIYSGKIIFQQPWITAETLNLDYFRNLTYFDDISDTIDLDDRFSPVYTSYMLREYYDSPMQKTKIGESQARQEWQKHDSRYQRMKTQIVAYYALKQEPATIDERW